jgi:hypothetical protein
LAAAAWALVSRLGQGAAVEVALVMWWLARCVVVDLEAQPEAIDVEMWHQRAGGGAGAGQQLAVKQELGS